jgi:Ser/Thr protein kinase RdoA (MazF antagonist)
MEDEIRELLVELYADEHLLGIEKVETYRDQVYRLETDQRAYFMKIFTDTRNDYLCEKLVSLYKLLADNNVPVPDVSHYDLSSSIIGSPFVILSEAEGEMMEAARPTELSFYEDLGRTLGKIHSITFDSFGESIDGKTVGKPHELGSGPFNTWKEMHEAIVKFRLGYFKGTAFDDLITPITDYFQRNSYLLDYDIVPRLLHCDLNQKNVFVKDGKVSSIIDLDGCFIGHNEEELMRTESANFSDDEDIRQAFFKGYSEYVELDEGYEQRRPFYYLSRLLVHIDCMIRFGDAYRPESGVEKVKKAVHSVLAGEEIDFTANR